MEMETSENFSHGQIGSNSQNYGGSAGSSSIHNGNNFGQMNANVYGSSQISNARPMSMSGKSIQSNMRSMVGTQGSSNMAGVSRSSTPQPMPKLQFADVEHAGTPQDTTFMTHGMVNSGNNGNGMMDKNYGSDAALSDNKGSNLNIGMLDQSYKS